MLRRISLTTYRKCGGGFAMTGRAMPCPRSTHCPRGTHYPRSTHYPRNTGGARCVAPTNHSDFTFPSVQSTTTRTPNETRYNLH
ncbi:MAG: hypothetical protein LBM98_07370 [Oscillospiraceae bacterium]|nr:hypothetical protein [Oscillospiraceae bacterium]